MDLKQRTANTGYSSLLLTFLSESPRKFAIFGLRQKESCGFFRNETIAKHVVRQLKGRHVNN